MKVFDNLYFVGDRKVAAWVLGSETDGYILIKALVIDQAAQTEIDGGMRKLDGVLSLKECRFWGRGLYPSNVRLRGAERSSGLSSSHLIIGRAITDL